MLGHLVYNHAHLDDARIQQEISKELYAPVFDGTFLVHTYNGPPAFGYHKEREDKLIRRKDLGHFRGAVDLMNAGLAFFAKTRIRGLRYVLVTAADTWMLDVDFLQKVVTEMEHEERVLAASSWGRAKAPEKSSGLSTDFFILDMEWNRESGLFPLDYDAFVERFSDLFALLWSVPTVEGAVQYKFQKYFNDTFEDNERWRNREAALRRIVEREPVHGPPDGQRTDNWPDIGLYTSPTPEAKRQALRRLRYDFGPHSRRLMTSKDLAYYNRVPLIKA